MRSGSCNPPGGRWAVWAWAVTVTTETVRGPATRATTGPGTIVWPDGHVTLCHGFHRGASLEDHGHPEGVMRQPGPLHVALPTECSGPDPHRWRNHRAHRTRAPSLDELEDVNDGVWWPAVMLPWTVRNLVVGRASSPCGEMISEYLVETTEHLCPSYEVEP